ncbi:transposase [Streptomyces sp. Inha503]|uniref:transposase n=1 Tax=Streptomyces sp. Inha503 TaxID=3383314 RepID=UPI00399F3F8B
MTLINVLRQVKAFYAGEPVVLVRDGLSAHWSRDMRARVAGQNWLTLERLPAYAPELNPVELLWSAIKTRELANLTGDHPARCSARHAVACPGWNAWRDMPARVMCTRRSTVLLR